MDQDAGTVEDLKHLKLSSGATLNVWCGRQAAIVWTIDITIPAADLYPYERLALYTSDPQHKKVIGILDENIICALRLILKISTFRLCLTT